jgi:polyferredoxin
MKYPRGLIRYATQNGIAKHLTRVQMFRRTLRPRVLIYGGVLLAISTGFAVSLMLRQVLKVDVVRDRTTLARIVDNGQIENVYRLQVMNATERTQHYRVAVQGLPEARLAAPAELDVGAAQARWLTVAVRVPPQAAQSAGPGAHPIRFVVSADAQAATVAEKSTFVIPR